MSKSLLTKRHGRVLTLTLNRPEKRNALNLVLCRALVGAIDAASYDDSVGAILLTSNGSAFSAGMDLSELRDPASSELSHVHEMLFTAGRRALRPIVAAVQGPALGGGCGLVANAHIAVASDSATFALTEVRVGLWPYLIYRSMVHALGERWTMELSLTGRAFSAKEAAAMGLVHHVVPAAELDQTALALASSLADSSAQAIRAGLEFVIESRGLPSEEAGKIAHRLRQESFGTADFNEGVAAFKQKRPPKWPSLVSET
jgi:enoyl-CoA hydratase/carnithine racemase